jgi:hypothetical protein
MPQDFTRRPDLEAIPVQFPELIGQHLYPWYERPNAVNYLYYQPLNDDVAAQTGRDTAAVATINANTIANAKLSFSCGEIIGRDRMSYDQVDSYGGVEGADIALARKAVRSLSDKVEIMIAKLALEDNSAVDVTTDIVAAIENEVSELQDLADGDVCLAISSYNFTQLKKNADIKDRMKNTGVLLGAGGDPRKVTAEQIAAILGVSRVYVGANKQWRRGVSAAYRGNACLFVEPRENIEPVEEVQLGRTIFQAWDGAVNRYIIGTFFDPKERAHYADCVGKIDVKTLNADLKTTLQLFTPDESDSDSDSN